MTQQTASRAARCLLVAALPLLLAVECTTEEGPPPPGPPATAYVSIDEPPARVDTASTTLQGEAECPDCSATDWLYGHCPQVQCPETPGEVWWSNRTSAATGPAAHAVAPVCHCPVFSYGYCYSACNHVWWATVPLGYGGNDVAVSALLPDYAIGSATALIERVPVAPTWIGAVPGPGSLTLSWNPVADATSYNLYWSTTPYGWASLCTKIAGVTSPFLHGGLEGGIPHYYFVAALVGDAESFDSLRLEATPQ